MNPTNPTQSTIDSKAGYSTPTGTINKKAFITGYEASNEPYRPNLRGYDYEPATGS